MACTAAIATSFAIQYRRCHDTLDPLCATMLMVFLMFPFHGFISQDELFIIGRLGSQRHEFMTYGLWAAAAGSYALILGYRSRGAAWAARQMPRFDREIKDGSAAVSRKLAILYLVGWMGRSLLVVTGFHFHMDTGTVAAEGAIRFQFILVNMDLLPLLVSGFIFAVGLKRGNRFFIQVALVLLLVEIIWGASSGSRLKLLTPVVVAVVIYGRARRPIRLSYIAAGVVLLIGVVFPLSTAFRTGYTNHLGEIGREGVSVGSVGRVMMESADEVEETTSTESPVIVFAERMHGLTSLALLIRYTPERHPYRLGSSWLMLPVMILIPRFIWPDKPSPNEFTLAFKSKYWGLERGSSTSIAVSFFGDLWSNLHLFGVLLGGFFLGIALRYLGEFMRFGIRGDSVYPLVAFAMLLLPFMRLQEGTVDGFVSGMAKTLFVFFLVGRFLSRRKARIQPVR